MIVSFSPGRIRLRFRELKDRGTAAQAEARIREIAGITGVELNVLTGSILVEYDTAVLPDEKLLEMGRRELAALGLPLEPPPGH